MVNGNGNDPLESFRNSVDLVKNAFAPLESSFKKVAKDFEHKWPGRKTNIDLFGVKKRNGNGVVSDDRKKKVPFLGIFAFNDSDDRKVDVSKKDLDSRKEDGTCVNCMQFAVTWSLLVSSIAQAVPGPFKNGKKNLHKKSNGEYKSKVSRDRNEFIAKGAFLESISGDGKRADLGNELVFVPCEETLKIKDVNGLAVENFIGFVLDQIAQNLHKFELGVQEFGSEKRDQVDHLKSVGGLLEGKKADFSGFLGNLIFARVGGVPPGIVDITSPVKDDSDDAVSSNGTEGNVGSFSQKMASGLLSIPLSNVERLRSTLSTVSLTELIELIPQIGRSTKDHPDKKKLFSVQDFFRYTEAEGTLL
ncbi:hypothetical protein Tco_1248314 [Tanacetum coccineum]